MLAVKVALAGQQVAEPADSAAQQEVEPEDPEEQPHTWTQHQPLLMNWVFQELEVEELNDRPPKTWINRGAEVINSLQF